MSAFGGLILTNNGRVLQAKVQAGAALHFNRIGVGDGVLGSQQISDLNVLISEKKSLVINKLKTQAGGKAIIGGVLSNQDVAVGFYFREIGFFAQDPDVGEILYCYANSGAGAEYISAAGGPDVIEKQIDVIVLTANAAQVTADISSGLYASAADLDAHIADVILHISAAERASWNAKESPAGAQAKVDAAINALINSAPGALDTLKELADAMGDDPNFATTITNSLAAKAPMALGIAYAAATGPANTYAVAPNPAPAALVDGYAIAVKINVDSTGASTLNTSVLGAKPLKKANGTDVTNLKANGVYTFRYNSATGNFILQGEGGSGNATAGDLLLNKTASTDAGDIVGTLTLTGNATDADVATGKTYYGTDAKTKHTGILVKGLLVGNGIIASAPTQRVGTASVAYQKIKGVTIKSDSMYRVQFDLQANSGGHTVYGQIFKNGVPYGIERPITVASFTTYVEDLYFNAEDTCEVWGHGDGTFSPVVQNFYIMTSIPVVTLN